VSAGGRRAGARRERSGGRGRLDGEWVHGTGSKERAKGRGLKPAAETRRGMRRQARPLLPPHLASLLRHASPHNAPD